MTNSALRLLAEDQGDLDVIASALQDAVTKIGDIKFERKGRRLTIAFNRYRWEGPGGERVRTILQFGSVIGVQARRLRPGVKDAVLELLTLSFQPQQAPGGLISLQFAGDGDLQVAVECIDAIMADVSAPWPTPRRPQHEA